MYKVKSKNIYNYQVISDVNGFKYLQDYSKSDSVGISPVALLSTALSGCTIMVAKSFLTQKSLFDVKLELDLSIEDKKVEFELFINKEISDSLKEELKIYLKEKCTVRKYMSNDIMFIEKISYKNI